MDDYHAVAAASLSEVTKVVDVLAWPVFVLLALWFATTNRGQRLFSPLLRRLRKVSGAGFALELSEETARTTKVEVEGGLKAYGGVLDDELRRLAHAYGVRAALQDVVRRRIATLPKVPEIRATVHVRDPLLSDALYQILDYYPRGTGGGRRFSTRFGILGRTWRLGRSQNEKAPLDEDQLITEWGMTREQASKSGKNRSSFMCIVLRSSREEQPPPPKGPWARLQEAVQWRSGKVRHKPVSAPREQGVGTVEATSEDGQTEIEPLGLQVGVLYVDAEPAGAFGSTKKDRAATLKKIEDSAELRELSAAVAAMDNDIRLLGPGIRVLDSD
jgi:hypothetical protein